MNIGIGLSIADRNQFAIPPNSLPSMVSWPRADQDKTFTGGAQSHTAGDKVVCSIADAAISPANALDPLTNDRSYFGRILFDSVAAGTVRILHKGGDAAGNAGWELIRNGTSLQFQIADGSTQKTITIGTVAASTWYFWCVTLDRDGNAVGYLDATAGTPVNINGLGTINNADDFMWGGDSVLATYFGGDICATGIANKSLSLSEVQGLYNNKQVKYYADHTAAEQAFLVVFWNGNETAVNTNNKILDQHASSDLTFSASEMATNGAFTSDASWTKGVGWTIDDADSNTAASDGTQAADSDLEQACAVQSGTTYATSMVVTRTAGNVCVVVGGTEGTDRAASNTFTQNITVSSSDNKIAVRADADFVGTVDTFSVLATSLVSANGPAEATATDFSGNGNDGTLTNFSAAELVNGWVARGAGYGLRFASGNYLLPPAVVMTASTSWTFRCKANSTDISIGSVYLCDFTSPRSIVAWDVSGTHVLGYFDGTDFHTFGATPNDGIEHDICFVAAGTIGKMYVDGVQSGDTKTIAAVDLSSAVKYVGGSGISYTFIGELDDVRIYNVAFTPSQVAELSTLDEDTHPTGVIGATCVGWWKFNDGPFSVPTDGDSILGLESRHTDRAKWNQTDAAARPAYDLQVAALNNRPGHTFNGTSHYLEHAGTLTAATSISRQHDIVTGSTAFATKGEQTLSCTTDVAAANKWFKDGIDNAGKFYVESNVAGTIKRATFNTTALVVETACHIEYTLDGTTLRGWINGVEQTISGDLDVKGPGAVSDRDNWIIGCLKTSAGTSQFFEGTWADSPLFGVQLNDAEVCTLQRYAQTRYAFAA